MQEQLLSQRPHQNQRYKYRRTQRLTKDREFDTVFKNGKRYNSNGISVITYLNDTEHKHFSRLGLVVSHKIGGAVERNKLKRRIRELFRLATPKLLRGYDIIVIPQKRGVVLTFDELSVTFEQLLIRAGVWRKVNTNDGIDDSNGCKNL
ncbi:MAG: ribonuclease P protein component [Elusimicrobiota bacterium]